MEQQKPLHKWSHAGKSAAFHYSAWKFYTSENPGYLSHPFDICHRERPLLRRKSVHIPDNSAEKTAAVCVEEGLKG